MECEAEAEKTRPVCQEDSDDDWGYIWKQSGLRRDRSDGSVARTARSTAIWRNGAGVDAKQTSNILEEIEKNVAAASVPQSANGRAGHWIHWIMGIMDNGILESGVGEPAERLPRARKPPSTQRPWPRPKERELHAQKAAADFHKESWAETSQEARL